MKRSKRILSCLMMALLPATLPLPAQDRSFAGVTERIDLCTDRTLYVSGENIRFSAAISVDAPQNVVDFSKILYAELIDADRKVLAKGKFPVEGFASQGCLKIPDEALTGVYCLKAYTRLMRNSGPDHYHYLMLKIIHPHDKEISGRYMQELPGQEWNIPPEGFTKTSGFDLATDKEAYQPGEQIMIRLPADLNGLNAIRYCLSVAPAASIRNIPLIIDTARQPEKPAGPDFYPETDGLTISGLVQDKENGLPVEHAVVNLSVIGNRDIMTYLTGPSGRFFFLLPEYRGDRDIFLSAAEITGKTLEIMIDNDFCPEPVDLVFPDFTLDHAEKETALQLVLNYIVQQAYSHADDSDGPTPVPEDKAFYGRPDEVLLLDKYIDLPTLEEYFNELPVMVKVRKSQGRKQFRFHSYRVEMSVYDPLVMVDWVAVTDMEQILSMPPKAIGRVELVNSPYVKGDITYGGIISFISRNNDFAGIDLPSSGIFIHYRFPEDCRDEIIQDIGPIHSPDPRNTVYWDPDMLSGVESVDMIGVTAPETPGDYVILLRGMFLSGEALCTWMHVHVKRDG